MTSHVIPYRFKRVVGWTTLTACFPYYFLMCQDEINDVPNIGQYYISLASSVETLFSKLFPFPNPNVVSKLGHRFFASSLDEFGACMTLHSSLQMGIGYLLPMSVLIAEETISKNDFVIEYHKKFQLIHRSSIVIAQSVLVVPFEIILAFQVAVQTAHLATWAFS